MASDNKKSEKSVELIKEISEYAQLIINKSREYKAYISDRSSINNRQLLVYSSNCDYRLQTSITVFCQKKKKKRIKWNKIGFENLCAGLNTNSCPFAQGN